MDTCILLVEDNKQIIEGNKYFLERRGYKIRTAVTISQARECMSRQIPDLIILDIMLPDGSGLDFLRELRRTSHIPVLLLTGLSGSADVVRGLSGGGDDYLSKPYDFSVLLARVEALLRRTVRVPEILQKGDLRLDILSGQAFWDGEDILLTPKQFALLFLLLRNEGKILSNEYLYESVWKQPLADDANALWRQMSHLRAKLCDKKGLRLTQVRGKGYSLNILQ